MMHCAAFHLGLYCLSSASFGVSGLQRVISILCLDIDNC